MRARLRAKAGQLSIELTPENEVELELLRGSTGKPVLTFDREEAVVVATRYPSDREPDPSFFFRLTHEEEAL